MIQVAHVITTLSMGGAEASLYRLLQRSDRRRFNHSVFSLTNTGVFGRKLLAEGFAVSALEMRRRWPSPGAVVHLARELGRRSPDVVQTWMYHGDLIGSIAARLAGKKAIVWNIRHGKLSRETNGVGTLLVSAINAKLSRTLPAAIICGSEAARSWHSSRGYCDDRMVVIPNGIDLEVYHPNSEARRQVRYELGINRRPLVGLVARFHPDKDHRTFISSAALVGETVPQAQFILIGSGIDSSNEPLIEWIRAAGLAERVHLLGQRGDVPDILAALDVMVLSSAAEGLPNVVLEAMGAGVPCVVTDVGDASRLVGDTGIVVPPKNPHRLAAGVVKLLSLSDHERGQLGLAARSRVEQLYSLNHMVEGYEEIWRCLASNA